MKRCALDEFRGFLDARGQSLSRARRLVFEEVLLLRFPFRMENLLERTATAGHRRVSRPVVYRTVSLLCEAGLLRTARTEFDELVYEHVRS